MKNIIKTLVLVMALILALAAFTGCELFEKECTHEGTTELIPSVIPTCTETGMSLGTKCTKCGAVVLEPQVTPVRGHDKTTLLNTTADCVTAGVETWNCGFCGEDYDVEVEAYGHDLVEVEAKAATCEADGNNAHKACSNCDYTEGKEVIPGGHTYGEADENGNKTCDRCGEILVSTPAGLQAALDKALEGTTIRLTENVAYGSVVLGRPTKYNDTKMYCATHEYTTDDAAAFVAHLAEEGYHTTPQYTTTLEGLTVIGANGATIEGLLMTSGHIYGDAYDYVRDIDYDEGSAYYVTLNASNIVFVNVQFTGKVDINTSDADSVYDGIAFEGCSFTTGGTDSTANGAGIRFYNESNNGNLRNLVIIDCKFVNCYQGVYVANVNNIGVMDSEFDTTGHNAIAIQSTVHGAVDIKTVAIIGNTFKNIGNRIIRFGEIGADSTLIIQNNTATDSGDEDGEVMKAVSIAEGVTTAIRDNSWCGTVANEELQDAE